MIKILEDLGFKCKKEKKYLKLTSSKLETRYFTEIDIVEELLRISGYDKIKTNRLQLKKEPNLL